MIPIERVLAKVTELRSAWAQQAVSSPDRENPAFAYGEAAGRDAAFAIVLESINEILSEEEEE